MVRELSKKAIIEQKIQDKEESVREVRLRQRQAIEERKQVSEEKRYLKRLKLQE